MSDVTFLHQRRSVATPCESRNVFAPKEVSKGPCKSYNIFWTKGGQLDPPVSDVTFFGPGGQSVGFHGFSRWFHGFSLFLVGFHTLKPCIVDYSPLKKLDILGHLSNHVGGQGWNSNFESLTLYLCFLSTVFL